MEVVEHNALKWLQEVLLEVEALEFLLHQELVRKLAERIDGKDCDHQVLMRAHLDEVLTEHLPDFGPNEPDSRHIQIGDFDNCL